MTTTEETKSNGERLEKRKRKASVANASVQLDLCKHSIKSGDMKAAREAHAKVGAEIDALDPKPANGHG